MKQSLAAVIETLEALADQDRVKVLLAAAAYFGITEEVKN